jgi:pimeloyl-ACP methyl ester carboxylesterase
VDTQNQPKHMAAPTRRSGCLLWLGRIALSLLGLLALGAIYELISEAADARAYPPPGQLVDVGGHRLHIYCTGSGSPTVVIDAGLGGWSTEWGGVQQEVARTTRVCTYDRAGMGWSEAGPQPRDAAQLAREEHALLHNAGERGRYVVVGHSMGGLVTRVFAHEYASDVAGVVLIESMNPAQLTYAAKAGEPMAYAPYGPMSLAQVWLARVGLARLLVKPLGLVPPLPQELLGPYLARLVRPSNLQATADETRALPASGAEAGAVKSLGDVPLIVLTGRLNTTHPQWQNWQAQLVGLSGHSQHMFAEKSGHGIQEDEPQAAIDAIVMMVQQVRTTASK